MPSVVLVSTQPLHPADIQRSVLGRQGVEH
jgi:hypothetical protein